MHGRVRRVSFCLVFKPFSPTFSEELAVHVTSGMGTFGLGLGLGRDGKQYSDLGSSASDRPCFL